MLDLSNVWPCARTCCLCSQPQSTHGPTAVAGPKFKNLKEHLNQFESPVRSCCRPQSSPSPLINQYDLRTILSLRAFGSPGAKKGYYDPCWSPLVGMSCSRAPAGTLPGAAVGKPRLTCTLVPVNSQATSRSTLQTMGFWYGPLIRNSYLLTIYHIIVGAPYFEPI